MNNTSILKTLYPKLISGTLSDEELHWLQEYFSTGDPEELFLLVRSALSAEDQIRSPSNSEDTAIPTLSEASMLKEVYSVMEKELKPQPRRRSVAQVIWLKRAAAAGIAAFALTMGWYVINDRAVQQPPAVVVTQDISPGRNVATLTLSDNEKIVLSDVADGQIAREAGVVITKSSDGGLIYEMTNAPGIDSNSLNTLSTAKGETYRIRLPDGTLVALNAESSITYATALNRRRDRRIELTGEAYFEVAPDPSRPFIVETGKQTIAVLGTHFNVKAYEDEPLTRTTLLEGAVKVSAKSEAQVLRPGQQAILSGRDGRIRVVDVEAADAVAWKDGYFMFNNEHLEDILARVARWYNVEVEYEDSALKKELFFGSVSRYENISKVLKLLEATGVAAFMVSGNKVSVIKSSK